MSYSCCTRFQCIAWNRKIVYIHWQICMYCVVVFSALAYFTNHPKSVRILSCKRLNGFHCGELNERSWTILNALPTELCWKMANEQLTKQEEKWAQQSEWMWQRRCEMASKHVRFGCAKNNSLNFMIQRVYKYTVKSCIVSLVIQFRCYCIARWTCRFFFHSFGFFSLFCVSSLCWVCVEFVSPKRLWHGVFKFVSPYVLKRKNASFSNCCRVFFARRRLTPVTILCGLVPSIEAICCCSFVH